MKIFQIVQKHYATLGIGSSDQSIQTYPFNEKVLIFYFVYGFIVISQLIYIFSVASGYLEYVEYISAIGGGFITFICYATIVLKSNTLFKLIENLEQFIATRVKYRKSKKFFLKTTRQVERLSGIVFFVVVKVILQCAVLPKCIHSFGVYFITDSGRNSFELPFPLWFPFDSKTPIGYSIAIIFEYILSTLDFFIISCALSLGIGLFWFGISASKEIRHILRVFDDKAHKNRNQSNKLALELLTELIYAHGAWKQMVQDFSTLFQPILMTLFTWSLMAICSALLIVHAQIMHHGNVMDLFFTLLNALMALATVFIACEVGQRLNGAFNKINFAFDQSDWYLYPIEIKRMLPMIISSAQQPVTLECFGSICCTRNVFKKIVTSSFSYFMALRHLSE